MHDVSHLLQNHINSAAVCNTHNTSLVVWICCMRKTTQLQNSSKVHHSAVCVQPQIQHMWLTTRWLQHPSSTNQIHLPPVCQSDTVLVSVIMWNIKRHISHINAHHCRNKKHTAQMNRSQTSGPSRVSDWSAALRWPEAEFLTVWRLQEMSDTCSSVKMTTQSARL